LHVPPAELDAVLASIHRVLGSGGIFFWGQYGGIDRESIFAGGGYATGRFFSYLTDSRMRAAAEAVGFEIVEFHTVDVDVRDEPGVHFQALTARRADESN
jgi:predicted methyltransferase